MFHSAPRGILVSNALPALVQVLEDVHGDARFRALKGALLPELDGVQVGESGGRLQLWSEAKSTLYDLDPADPAAEWARVRPRRGQGRP